MSDSDHIDADEENTTNNPLNDPSIPENLREPIMSMIS